MVELSYGMCKATDRSKVMRPMARTTRTKRGFTLIETALATIIVGVGVLSIVGAQQAFHKQNSWSTHASTAMRLANEIREMTLNLPQRDPVTGPAIWGPEGNETFLGAYDDLDDFDGGGDGVVFSADVTPDPNGPVNAQRAVIPNMAGWAQIITVRNVDPFDITSVEDDGTTTMMKVEVVVTYQGPNDTSPTEMTRVSWLTPN
jgi:prepilin-type N-terminal cleavage/methylation domain-containing protein